MLSGLSLLAFGVRGGLLLGSDLYGTLIKLGSVALLLSIRAPGDAIDGA